MQYQLTTKRFNSIEEADYIYSSTSQYVEFEPSMLIDTKLMANQLWNSQIMNNVSIRETQLTLAAYQSKIESCNFFFRLILALVIYQFFLGCLVEYNAINNLSWFNYAIGPITIVSLGFFSYWLAKKSSLSWKDCGLTLQNWKTELIQGLLWTACFGVSAIGIKYLLTLIPGSPIYGDAVLNQESQLWNLDTTSLICFLAFYVLLVPIQEFASRGVLQTELTRIFSGDLGKHYAIFLSSAIFSSFHLMLDFKFAILTFIPGIFWGYLFDRQQGLLGVTVSHIVIGVSGLLFLASS